MTGRRVCVAGCGAIGTLYAAHLARLPDVEVWVYDVSRELIAAVARDGLRVTGATELTATVRATADPAEIPPCEFGIVATKSAATPAVAAALTGALAGGAVCSVQNGIGNEEALAARLARVIRGVTLTAVGVAGPGAVVVHGVGETWIGPFEPRPADPAVVAELAGLLTDAGLPATACADARGPQWTKLLFNCATNPVCALTGLTHGEMCDHAPTRELAAGLVAEGRAVAAALGIALEEDPLAMVIELGRAHHAHRPSMLQDVAARRLTEIDALNGGLARAGAGCGVPTPLNAAIHALVTGLEASWAQAA